MTCNFLSLLLQAIGGAIADTADTATDVQTGLDIMIAGLLMQAISLAVFLVVVADFGRSCWTGRLNMDPVRHQTRRRKLFRLFLAGLLLPTMTILVRSVFRVAELWAGFQGELWNNETAFLILDGMMIAIASVSLTILHPGPAFDGGMWSATDWSFKAIKGNTSTTDLELRP